MWSVAVHSSAPFYRPLYDCTYMHTNNLEKAARMVGSLDFRPPKHNKKHKFVPKYVNARAQSRHWAMPKYIIPQKGLAYAYHFFTPLLSTFCCLNFKQVYAVLTNGGVWMRAHKIKSCVTHKVGCLGHQWTLGEEINNWNSCSWTCYNVEYRQHFGPYMVILKKAKTICFHLETQCLEKCKINWCQWRIQDSGKGGAMPKGGGTPRGRHV